LAFFRTDNKEGEKLKTRSWKERNKFEIKKKIKEERNKENGMNKCIKLERKREM
jgi:hypothetical protein